MRRGGKFNDCYRDIGIVDDYKKWTTVPILIEMRRV